MKDSILTAEVLEPYAQALLSLGQSSDLTDRFGEDASSILAAFNDSPDLREFLASPIVNLEAKRTVLQQVFGEQVHSYVQTSSICWSIVAASGF
ncbi:MAG: hypothetical protein HC936_19370 [Leptolyngbyaceae cyanobacterium SU_3_3]|nr:hypothetical protein [Leptolyngbyaceae cyanobacterium SU_3_3]